MPTQVQALDNLDQHGLVIDTPATKLPQNAFSDALNVRFDDGAIRKFLGHQEILAEQTLGTIVFTTHWANPNRDYYIVVIESNARHTIYSIELDGNGDAVSHVRSESEEFSNDGNWQTTSFLGGYSIIMNNGIDSPRHITAQQGVLLADELFFEELPGWASYNVTNTRYTREITAEAGAVDETLDITPQFSDEDLLELVVNIAGAPIVATTDYTLANVDETVNLNRFYGEPTTEETAEITVIRLATDTAISVELAGVATTDFTRADSTIPGLTLDLGFAVIGSTPDDMDPPVDVINDTAELIVNRLTVEEQADILVFFGQNDEGEPIAFTGNVEFEDTVVGNVDRTRITLTVPVGGDDPAEIGDSFLIQQTTVLNRTTITFTTPVATGINVEVFFTGERKVSRFTFVTAQEGELTITQAYTGFSVQAGIVESFGNLLIAGDLREIMTVGDDEIIVRNLRGTVRTSNVAAAGSIPNNWNPFVDGAGTAEELTLAETGTITAMRSLQNAVYVYTADSIHRVALTTNPNLPLSSTVITNTYGAVSQNAVVEYEGKHVVVGSNDIYIFSGHPGDIQSIADGKVRRDFFSKLNPNQFGNLFMLRNQAFDEIWICYTSIAALTQYPDIALVWNYRSQVWTNRALPNVTSGTVAPIPGGGSPNTRFTTDVSSVSGDNGQLNLGRPEVQTLTIPNEIRGPHSGIPAIFDLAVQLDNFDADDIEEVDITFGVPTDGGTGPVLNNSIIQITIPNDGVFDSMVTAGGGRIQLTYPSAMSSDGSGSATVNFSSLGLDGDQTSTNIATALASFINTDAVAGLSDWFATSATNIVTLHSNTSNVADDVATDVYGPRNITSGEQVAVTGILDDLTGTATDLVTFVPDPMDVSIINVTNSRSGLSSTITNFTVTATINTVRDAPVSVATGDPAITGTGNTVAGFGWNTSGDLITGGFRMATDSLVEADLWDAIGFSGNPIPGHINPGLFIDATFGSKPIRIRFPNSNVLGGTPDNTAVGTAYPTNVREVAGNGFVCEWSGQGFSAFWNFSIHFRVGKQIEYQIFTHQGSTPVNTGRGTRLYLPGFEVGGTESQTSSPITLAGSTNTDITFTAADPITSVTRTAYAGSTPNIADRTIDQEGAVSDSDLNEASGLAVVVDDGHTYDTVVDFLRCDGGLFSPDGFLRPVVPATDEDFNPILGVVIDGVLVPVGQELTGEQMESVIGSSTSSTSNYESAFWNSTSFSVGGQSFNFRRDTGGPNGWRAFSFPYGTTPGPRGFRSTASQGWYVGAGANARFQRYHLINDFDIDDNGNAVDSTTVYNTQASDPAGGGLTSMSVIRIRSMTTRRAGTQAQLIQTNAPSANLVINENSFGITEGTVITADGGSTGTVLGTQTMDTDSIAWSLDGTYNVINGMSTPTTLGLSDDNVLGNGVYQTSLEDSPAISMEITYNSDRDVITFDKNVTDVATIAASARTKLMDTNVRWTGIDPAVLTNVQPTGAEWFLVAEGPILKMVTVTTFDAGLIEIDYTTAGDGNFETTFGGDLSEMVEVQSHGIGETATPPVIRISHVRSNLDLILYGLNQTSETVATDISTALTRSNQWSTTVVDNVVTATALTAPISNDDEAMQNEDIVITEEPDTVVLNNFSVVNTRSRRGIAGFETGPVLTISGQGLEGTESYTFSPTSTSDSGILSPVEVAAEIRNALIAMGHTQWTPAIPTDANLILTDTVPRDRVRNILADPTPLFIGGLWTLNVDSYGDTGTFPVGTGGDDVVEFPMVTTATPTTDGIAIKRATKTSFDVTIGNDAAGAVSEILVISIGGDTQASGVSGQTLLSSIETSIETSSLASRFTVTTSTGQVDIVPIQFGDNARFITSAPGSDGYTGSFNRGTVSPVTIPTDINLDPVANPDGSYGDFSDITITALNATVNTDLDLERPWARGVINQARNFLVMSSTDNNIYAMDLGYTHGDGEDNLYESYVERKKLHVTPSKDTESIHSIFIEAEGNGVKLQVRLATTNASSQDVDLTQDVDGVFREIHNVSTGTDADYKTDLRRNGRFINLRITDQGLADSEWLISSAGLEIGKGGTR